MNELAIAVVAILFPGLIATVIADKVVVHSKNWGSFKYSVYSFVLGVSCYLSLQILVWLLSNFYFWAENFSALSGDLDVWNLLAGKKNFLDFMEISAATCFSPFVALFAAFIVNHKLLNRFAGRLGISSRIGDENLFSYFLDASSTDWVYVRDVERKIIYRGKAGVYSQNATMQELILSHVTVFSDDLSTSYRVPVVYICRPPGQIIIETIPDDLLMEDSDGKESVR